MSGYGTNNGISYVLGDQLGSASVIVAQSGAAQATNYYFPFGGNRGGSAFSDQTTKRFTGQYHEAGLPGGEGLSYYNARWYDAQLGRFISADTIVPQYEHPQNLNRYSYVLNQPLQFTDPSGHCPTPPPGFGSAICFALFIKPATIPAAGVLNLHGDGRNFSNNSDPKASRAWVWINVDEAKHVVGTVSTGYVNSDGSLSYFEPYSAANKIEVERGANGEITLSYNLVLSGVLRDVAPHINGTITFIPDKKAGGYITQGDRDGFPWAEAYFHDGKGHVRTIFRQPALRSNPEDLNAMEETDFFVTRRPLHFWRNLVLNKFMNEFIRRDPPKRDSWDFPFRPKKPC